MNKKKLFLVLGITSFLIFGGLFVRNQVLGDEVFSSDTSFIGRMGGFFRMGPFNNGCFDEDRGFGMMGGYYNNSTQELDETYYVIFPELDGIDSLVGETFHVLVVDSDSVVVFEDDLSTNPAGGVGVWLANDFEGTLTVTYGDFSGTTDLSQDADNSWCLAQKVIVTLE